MPKQTWQALECNNPGTAHTQTADLALLVSLALLIANAQLIWGLSLLHYNHLEASSSQPLRMSVIVLLRKATMRLLSLAQDQHKVTQQAMLTRFNICFHTALW